MFFGEDELECDSPYMSVFSDKVEITLSTIIERICSIINCTPLVTSLISHSF